MEPRFQQFLVVPRNTALQTEGSLNKIESRRRPVKPISKLAFNVEAIELSINPLSEVV